MWRFPIHTPHPHTPPAHPTHTLPPTRKTNSHTPHTLPAHFIHTPHPHLPLTPPYTPDCKIENQNIIYYCSVCVFMYIIFCFHY